jgi:hypothetical protein
MSGEVILDMSEPGPGDERSPPQLVLCDLHLGWRCTLHSGLWRKGRHLRFNLSLSSMKLTAQRVAVCSLT